MKYIILFFTVFLSYHSFSQITISGKAYNKNGKPVSFANIYIKKDTALISGTITDTLGYYQITNLNSGKYYLCCSVIGYNDTCLYINLQRNSNIDFNLKEQTVVLNGVEVTAQRPTITNNENKIIINFNQSTLKNIETGESVLKYLPGIVKTKSGYKIFGKGSPLILINDKKSSSAELSALKPEDIIKVEMFDNDGSYDAEIQYIINIKTKKRNNFIGGQIYNSLSYTTLLKNDFRVYMTINKNKLQQSIYYKNSYGYSPWIEQSINNVYDTTNNLVFNSNFDLDATDFINNNYLYYAVNYDIDTNMYIGFQINGNYGKTNNEYFYKSFINNSYLLNTTIENESYYDIHPSINFNLTTKNKHNISLICDYYNSLTDNAKNINEDNINYNDLDNNISYEMSSVKADYLLPVKKIKSSINFGSKYFKTLNNNKISNINSTNESEINKNYLLEKSYAGYISIKNKSIKSVFIQFGARFEHFFREIKDFTNDSTNSWTLNNFFPNINIKYKLNKTINISLNYLKYIDRSAYSYITNQNVYINPYLYKLANPYLKPDIINSYSLNTTFFNAIQLQMGYKTHNNYTTMYFSNKDSIIIVSYDNFDKQELFLSANMTMQNNQSITNIGINVTRPFFKYEVLGKSTEIENLNYSFYLSNSISFAKKYKSDITINYQPKSYYDLFIYEPTINIDIGIKRFFFNNRFRISLYYTYNNVSEYKMNYKQIELLHKYSRNKHVFFISLLYKFNFNKKWVEKENSLDEEINRIN